MPPRPPLSRLLYHNRLFSTTPRRLSTPFIPTIPTCPSPTCACAPFQEDLDIDRKTPLLHTMAPYAHQVVFCTGTTDWASNIEADEGVTGEFVRGMKAVVGRGSRGFDPFNNILLTASSLPNSTPKTTPPLPEGTPTTATTALLFPSFEHLSVPHNSTAFSALAAAYLRPTTLHPSHASLTFEQQSHLLRDSNQATRLSPPESINTPTILICGHGARDSRCGVLGPLLQGAFERELERIGIEGRVAQVSHVGGHKWAGNVIVYLPPSWSGSVARFGVVNDFNDGECDGDDSVAKKSSLAGAGIWYGRVGPEHVEGIVGETIVNGRVVMELLRGGVLKDGGDLAKIVERQSKRGNESIEEKSNALKLRPKARK